MKVYIYTLSDPRDNAIRYVGKTDDLKERYDRHCSINRGKDHRSNWLNKLQKLDLKPIIQIIEQCDKTNWIDRERYWIKYYREMGCNLVNGTDGGEGTNGHSHNEETRRKISEAQKGNANRLGKSTSAEARHKISEANKGKMHSEEVKRKIGESRKLAHQRKRE